MPEQTSEERRAAKALNFKDKVISFVDNLRPKVGTGSATKAHKDLSDRAKKLKQQEKDLGI